MQLVPFLSYSCNPAPSRYLSHPASNQTSTKTKMSADNSANCRPCRLKIFCYDHIQAEDDNVEVPTQSEEIASDSKHTKPTEEDHSIVASHGTFERSESGDSEEDSTEPSIKSQCTRDQKLPRILVNGVELPYWTGS